VDKQKNSGKVKSIISPAYQTSTLNFEKIHKVKKVKERIRR